MASTERTPDAGAALATTPAAGAGNGARPASRRLLLFAVRGRVYGCHIEAVREIVPFRRCTRLPGAPPYVCGLINLRGTIVTVLDLGVRLGVGSVDRGEGSIVLVEHGAKVVGLGVDELRDVQHVEYDRAPHGAAGSAPEESSSSSPGAEGVILGLGHLDGDVIVVLDVQAIVKQALL